MIKLEDINKDIVFRESDHTYTHKSGERLLSTTTVLGLYKTPFDPTGIIAYKCAKNEGITTEEILKRWQDKKDVACEYGTKVHGEFEEYLKTGKITPSEDSDIIKELSKIKFQGKIYSELALNSLIYKISGTCDVATLNKNLVEIYDLKTNREFTIKSKYGKKFLHPISHIPDSHLHGYSLQILIYGEMVKEYGYDFKPGQILWIDPDARKVEKYDVLDLRKEVKDLLNHYKSINEL
jgi:hypothetical protein